MSPVNTFVACAAVLAAAVLGSRPAHAIPILPSDTFPFTSDHCTGGCLTGQTTGGTITVTDLGGGELHFDVSLLNGDQFINTGIEASFGFNLTGITSVTYSNIVVASDFTIPGGVGMTQATDALHMDGTGFFNFGLDGVGNGGSDPDGSTLSFDITATT